MNLIRTLGSLPTVIATFTAITGIQIGLIAFGNITDYQTNHQFVTHVLAMDTTFESPHVMWRAITDPALATAAYLAIIGWETLAGIVLGTATVLWVRALGTGCGTDLPRRVSTLGWLMWVLLFGGGFIAIGGEWFQMWQSDQWNGLQPALQNLLIAVLGLILVHLPENPTRTSKAAPDFQDEHAESA